MNAKSEWDELEALFESASADQLCEALIDRMMNVIPAKKWKSHEEFAVEMLFLTKEFVTFARRFSSIKPEHKAAIVELEAQLRHLLQSGDQKGATTRRRDESLIKRFEREAAELSEAVEQISRHRLDPEATMILEQFDREVPDWRNLGGKALDRARDDFVKSHTSKDGKWWWDGSQWRPIPSQPAR